MADSPGRTSKQLYPSAADLAGYNQQLVDRFQSPKDPSQFSSFTLFPERDPKTSSESPSFAWQDLQGFSSPSTLQQSGRPLSDFSPPTPYRPTYEDFYSRGGNPQELSPPITNPLDLYPPGGPLDLSPPVQPFGSVGSYNGYSSHYQASADNHLFDLSEARHQGFDIYSKSLEEWNNFSEYSPFGSRQTISYSPVQEKDSTNKPSYSEVARTLRAKSAVSGKAESESSKRKVEVPTLKPIRSFKKPFIKPHHHFKGRSGVGEPPSLPVHPDSKYGLDQFDDLSLTRKNSLGCCSTVEEKTSSIESLDKIGHLEKYTNNRAGPNSVTEEIHLTSPISFQGNKRDSPSPCQDSRLKEKGSKSCSSKPLDKPPKMANTNSQSSEAKPFFDPKRIFQSKPCSSQATAKKSQSAGNSTSSSASSGSSSTVLNNGKVSYSSKPSATAHKRTSDYINNDLRDTRKKSSNHGCTKREHDTPEKNVKDDTCSGKFCSKPDKSKGVYTRQSSKPRSAGNVSEPNGSSSSARLREGEESSSRPIIDQELIDEWLLTCQEKFRWLCRHAWSILVTIVVLLITLIAFIVSNLFVFVGKICSKVWTFVRAKLFRGGWNDKSGFKPGDPRLRPGLDENIILPTTGEEAMQRLFACKGKDPYSILGLHFEASDEEIKKYYKRQAVLVHPDKDKRRHYDSQLLEATEAETAMQEFADLLTKLQEKIQEAANMMRCDNCGGKHRRVPVSRPWYSARFCDRCNQWHSVKEGDVWAETSVLGFLWHYYACMEGKVYDITEWVKCRSEFFKHMQPNAHHVFYRIATEGNRSHQQGRSGENDLEDFINHLFHRAMNAEGADSAQWPGQKHGATTTQSNGKDTNVRRKRKKKKH